MNPKLPNWPEPAQISYSVSQKHSWNSPLYDFDKRTLDAVTRLASLIR
jgi:hypothetical protein